MANAESRQTPLHYSPDDARRIRQMIATPGEKLVCPQCDEELTTGLPIAGGGTGSSGARWQLSRCACIFCR